MEIFYALAAAFAFCSFVSTKGRGNAGAALMFGALAVLMFAVTPAGLSAVHALMNIRAVASK